MRLFDRLQKEDIENLINSDVENFNVTNYINQLMVEQDISLDYPQYLNTYGQLKEFDFQERLVKFYGSLFQISNWLFHEYCKRNDLDLTGILRNTIFSDEIFIKNDKNISLIIDSLDSPSIIESLKYLYTDMIGLIERKKSGTEFTPVPIIEFMYDTLGYDNEQILERNLFEPGCGSGLFMSTAIHRIIEVNQKANLNIIDLLLEKKIISGIDINPINVHITKLIIVLELVKENLVNEIEVKRLLLELPFEVKDFLMFEVNGEYDYIIGNPPYVRLHNLQNNQKAYIKQTYASATGRYDLYVCFIEKAIKLLKKDAYLSLITSNKYLTANYGVGIRDYISKHLDVELIFDLHDTKYFEASVLPAIITGRKISNYGEKDSVIFKNSFDYFYIKEFNAQTEIDEETDVFQKVINLRESENEQKRYFNIKVNNIIKCIEFGYSVEKIPGNETWNFGSKDEKILKSYIENCGDLTLKNIADICVGVKTTADSVFVKPMTEEFVKCQGFEKEIVYPLISIDNVDKWYIRWDGNNSKDRYILYPHCVENGKMVAANLDLYPNVKKYIYENEDILRGRKYLSESKTRKWYECWVPQHLDKFKRLKIVTRDIVSKNSFALDRSGYICQGNTFFITVHNHSIYDKYMSENDFLMYLLGILNSSVMEFYQKTISGSLYSKKYRYTTSNLNKWPIVKIQDSNIHIVWEIICTVDYLLNNINQGTELTRLECKLDSLVYQLYKISPEQEKVISDFLHANT